MKWFWPAGLGALIFGTYLATLPPGIYLEDSGDLVTASQVLGIPHPTGYPLYLLLGKVFLFLPAGSAAYRLGIFSALCAAGAAVFLFLSMRRLGAILKFGNGWYADALAAALVIGFALCRDFWSQAIIPEVYALNAFFAALITFLFLRWWQRRRDRDVYFLVLAGALGLSNHPVLLFLFAVYGAVVLWASGRRGLKFYLINSLLLTAGLVPYLYLLIRGRGSPAYAFVDVRSVPEFLRYIFRDYYKDTGLLGFFPDKGKFLASFWIHLFRNLGPLIAGMGILGGGALLLRKQPKLLIAFLGGFLSSFVLPIYLRNLSFSFDAAFVYRVYYFQAYLVLVILAYALLVHPRFRRFWILAFLVLSVGGGAAANFDKLNLRNLSVEGYYEQKLLSFPQDAVYVTVGEGYDQDTEIFVLLYLQKIRGLRPDVMVVDAAHVLHDLPIPTISFFKDSRAQRAAYLEYAVKNFGSARPLVTNFPVEPYGIDLVSHPTGFAVLVLPSGETRDSAAAVPTDGLRHPRETWDNAYQDFLAAALYQKALREIYEGRGGDAGQTLLSAIRFDNQVNSEDYRAFVDYRSSLTKKAD